jgi:hypothetical protein
MNLRLLCYFGVGLLAPACAVHADSERSILPQFRTQRLTTATVLIAPTFERSLSTPESFSLPFGVPTFEPRTLPMLRAATQNFELSFAGGVARAFAQSNTKLAPVVLMPQLRDSYFSNLGAFLSVTIDGSIRYEIPGEDALKAANASVDYSLVLSNLDCHDEIWTSEPSSSRACVTSCRSRFIIWSYGLKCAVTEGSVWAKGDCSESDFKFADAMGYEVASHAPFPTLHD